MFNIELENLFIMIAVACLTFILTFMTIVALAKAGQIGRAHV